MTREELTREVVLKYLQTYSKCKDCTNVCYDRHLDKECEIYTFRESINFDDLIEYLIEALSEPTKTDILSDIADLKKSPWFTFGENSLNPISREQYLARKEAVEVIEDLCIKRIDSEPTKTEPKKGHWIMTSDYYTGAYETIDYVKCSCCGEESLEEGNFCPNCGAEMESE